MSVYTVVKKIADERQISIKRVEKDLSLSNGTVSKWNQSMLRADALRLVGDYLNVTSSYILNKNRKE